MGLIDSTYGRTRFPKLTHISGNSLACKRGVSLPASTTGRGGGLGCAGLFGRFSGGTVDKVIIIR